MARTYRRKTQKSQSKTLRWLTSERNLYLAKNRLDIEDYGYPYVNIKNDECFFTDNQKTPNWSFEDRVMNRKVRHQFKRKLNHVKSIAEAENFMVEINKRAKEALKAIYDLKNNHSKIIPTRLSYVKSLSPKDLNETDFIMFSLGNKLNCEFRYIKNDDGQLELKIRNVITGDYFPPSLIDELYLAEKFKIGA